MVYYQSTLKSVKWQIYYFKSMVKIQLSLSDKNGLLIISQGMISWKVDIAVKLIINKRSVKNLKLFRCGLNIYKLLY